MILRLVLLFASVLIYLITFLPVLPADFVTTREGIVTMAFAAAFLTAALVGLAWDWWGS